jgi:predicted adenine nucleotide alpha hydrolase (AANH) superfamily ATPase
MYFNNNTNVSNDHDLSLNEFIDFYENFNLDLVEINYENYSVRIKGYSIYENIISEAYVIELTYSDESLTATYISDSNE